MSSPSRSISIASAARAAVLLTLFLADPDGTGAQSPASAPAVPSAAGVVPGQRVRVLERVPQGNPITAEPDRRVDGLLAGIDSASVTVRLDDGTVLQFARADVESVKVYAGRSHWFGLLAGWLATLPVAAFVCRDAKYECDEGGAIGLVFGIVGAAIGWPRWQDVPFP
jgi:hypothetical protein